LPRRAPSLPAIAVFPAGIALLLASTGVTSAFTAGRSAPVAPVLAAAVDCAPLDDTAFERTVAASRVIVLAVVLEGDAALDDTSATSATLKPAVFLKGPPSAGNIVLRSVTAPCGRAPLPEGSRVVVLLGDGTGTDAWPDVNHGFFESEGAWRTANPVISRTYTEAEIVDRIRSLTNQAVEPASGDEGASIDWLGTILPVGAALAGILVVGLILMRTWHRIDPS
jgi:hypothetical protein